jgi:hypothetical protein
MKALYSIALSFGLLFATAAANAQGFNVRADVPFDFVVANQTLPAGEYEVRPGATSDQMLIIQSSDGSKAALAITYACGGGDPSKHSELVFHRVGNQYFLSQVQVQGYAQGRELPKNRTEAEAEAEVASNQKADSVVIVADLVKQ